MRRVRAVLGAMRREVEPVAEVLLERAAERDVEHLHPAARAEHRDVPLAGSRVSAISSSSRTRSGVSFDGCASLA